MTAPPKPGGLAGNRFCANPAPASSRPVLPQPGGLKVAAQRPRGPRRPPAVATAPQQPERTTPQAGVRKPSNDSAPQFEKGDKLPSQ